MQVVALSGKLAECKTAAGRRKLVTPVPDHGTLSGGGLVGGTSVEMQWADGSLLSYE